MPLHWIRAYHWFNLVERQTKKNKPFFLQVTIEHFRGVFRAEGPCLLAITWPKNVCGVSCTDHLYSRESVHTADAQTMSTTTIVSAVS